jgi:hypothetical protein
MNRLPDHIIFDIDLRWTLRDIRARRSMLLPHDPQHLEELTQRGWIEIQDGVPVLSKFGLDALDVY